MAAAVRTGICPKIKNRETILEIGRDVAPRQQWTPGAIKTKTRQAVEEDVRINKYKDGDDCIGYHRDRETGWVEGTGFATLCFGAERDFQVKHEASGVVDTVLHRDGHVLYMPYPMNQECLHGVPKRKKVNGCRISLTFREIAS